MGKPATLRTAQVPVGQLVEHPRNPRRGDVDAIRASIKAHGFFAPVVCQKATNHVLVGNHRLRAAIAEGMTSVPVVWLDVDDDEALRVLLVDNRASDLGSYAQDVLASLLADLTDRGGLDGTLWTDGDLDGLLASLTEPAPKPAKPDPRPDPTEGDVVQVLAGTAEWTIAEGDVLERLRGLPDGFVQCVVTSPPYWGLRDYGTAEWEGGDAECQHSWDARPRASRPNPTGSGIGKGGSTHDAQDAGSLAYRDVCGKCGAVRVDAQLGLEPTPEEHVGRMVEVFREVRRVLRDDGTLWLNYGDTYATGGSKTTGRADSLDPDPPGRADGSTRGGPRTKVAQSNSEEAAGARVPESRHSRYLNQGSRPGVGGLKPKDLVGMPWRVAFALQADGWWLRSDIIWAKRNCMPESVTDRPTKAHEYLFLLTKSPTYHYDADAVREHTGREASWNEWLAADGRRQPGGTLAGGVGDGFGGKDDVLTHPNGRNLWSWWPIATEPLAEAHFATFPRALVRPCIRAGTSERGICPKCGTPWTRDVEATGGALGLSGGMMASPAPGDARGRPETSDGTYERHEVGWHPACECHVAQEPDSCATCGTAYRRRTAISYARTGHSGGKLGTDEAKASGTHQGPQNMRLGQAYRSTKTKGFEPACECDGPTVGSLVLDPFAGSGTTGVVALQEGQRFIGIELSHDYAEMARTRIRRFREETSAE